MSVERSAPGAVSPSNRPGAVSLSNRLSVERSRLRRAADLRSAPRRRGRGVVRSVRSDVERDREAVYFHEIVVKEGGFEPAEIRRQQVPEFVVGNIAGGNQQQLWRQSSQPE